MKYLVEISEQGFKQYEFLSRMLYYKKDPDRVIAWMQCLKRPTEQGREMLTKFGNWTHNKNWKKLFQNDDPTHQWITEVVQLGVLNTKTILNKTIEGNNFVKTQLE